ncbi:hypothetical protein [Streptomyces sp. NPDC004284]|uniref:DUF7144 family membrane protein n=1 Tax=Streptomyces sp. NPDC004284 TaxID=3364695 RepID=UPI00368632B1
MNQQPQPATGHAWAAGSTVLGGVLLSVLGVVQIFQGIAAISKDEVYAHFGDYVFKFDLTAWGWIHLALGVIAVAVGLGLLWGLNWARVGGIVMASLIIIANFMWLPYAPGWAIIAIGISVFVIWGLCKDWGHRYM